MAGARRTVVQLLPALDAGGVERSTLEIADALVRAGHRAIVVSAGGGLVPRLTAVGAEHVTLDIGRKSPLTVRHIPALRRLFERERVDLVHARSRLPAWIGWRAIRGMRANAPRWVTSVHGLNSPSRYSAIMTSGERVICVSQTVHDYVLEHYPRTNADKLRVIPRGVDVAAFPYRTWPDRDARRRAATLHPALDGDGPLLLLPGRGTRLKGHADALTLLAGLRADGRDARLWMPGSRVEDRERYLDELQAIAERLGIAEVVAFTPPTLAIADAYAASDLVLQLSRKPEAFGRTVLEALATGRSVVGWDHGGVGELLRRYDPRGAVPPFDGTLLERTAHALLDAPPPRPVTMPHTLRAMQEATLAVYAELEPR
ncbi:Glycosyl transferase [Lysobacter dokdonensis DS-58]|uniref:Glycosyl transferase n=1 Tax=Lysobacter dokdonensis DS-58 TaxID=1300345 RepID=A0A0A2WET0_9GAMM|nr:glycosyltransferase [Lysobacter dokdonensis]KGQ18263.1 Glycosyl transferase [Lysobacter dokdonensis DS-58]